ncbi:hypothetical protein EON81_04460 [bacterium]|nr:MAG: hypothetical protein EON81_04460 [bacterium]
MPFFVPPQETLKLVAPPLPSAKAIRFGKAIPCTVEDARLAEPAHPNFIPLSEGVTRVRRGNRWIDMKPADSTDEVKKLLFGVDGSIALERGRTYAGSYFEEPMSTRTAYIREGESERSIGPFVHFAWYRDRKNYVAYDGDQGEGNYGRMGTTLPKFFRVLDGEKEELGPGTPVRVWDPYHILAVTLNGFDEDRPSPGSFPGTFLRYARKGRTDEIGDFNYLGSTPERRIFLAQPGVVAIWRDGRFSAVHRLPAGWQGLASNPRGDVLLGSGLDKPDTRYSFAILCGGAMRRLTIPDVARLNQKRVRAVRDFRDDRSFVFTASWTYDSLAFRVKSRN